MEFLNQQHEERFYELLMRDKTRAKDNERRAFFYIFAGNEFLYHKVQSFYDFEEHGILPEGFKEVDLPSSMNGLAELAFNLYNNFHHEEKEMKSVINLFAALDENNFELAVNAIRVRFNK